ATSFSSRTCGRKARAEGAMKAQTFLAIKFLSGKKRSFLVSFLTWMAILGVLVSVASFIVVEAVMVGFGKDLQAKVIGFSPHLSLTMKAGEGLGPDLLVKSRQVPGVRDVSRFVEGEAVLRTEEDETQGVRVRGIDASAPPFPADFQVYFEEGEDWSSLQAKGEELPGIVLGKELAASLGIVPMMLEKVELLYPFGEVGPTGEVEPTVRAFRVVGTFKSGYFDYDNKFALASLGEVQRVFGANSPEQLGVYFKDPGDSSKRKASFGAFPGVDRVATWQERNARLFSALRLERGGMALVLVLMTLLASFNILSMLMMVVYERRRDLAVLKSLGMGEAGIGGIFYRAGLWIGVLGGLSGIIVGGGICLLLRVVKLPLPAPYYLDALPVDLNPWWMGLTFLLALGVSLAATWLPAREGRRLTVVEALRYE
ncbi:MAG: ABC transporter permease, partial [Deltaproteobacteria bacterium]|nr:ABC transporter permease [Deltaproteobacteria bacterium]